MSRTLPEALTFVAESRFALEKFYEVLEVRRQALDAISRQITDLLKREQDEHKWYVDWGQWEGDANHVFVQYMRRVEQMSASRTALEGGAARDATLRKLMAGVGATESDIGISAGAVLQVAKQVLSYRFGPKGNIPLRNARFIGTQTVIEVIWEGRNHAMHWEEGKPGSSSEAMLLALQADGLLTVRPGENHAVDLLDVLGWRSASDTMQELEQLVQL
jgi:hypothetical protein